MTRSARAFKLSSVILRRIGIKAVQHVADHAHRARAAEYLQPSHLPVSLLHRLEFQPDRRARPFQALRGNSAVVEEAGAQTHATHGQALEQERIKALADDDFGRTAADVDDQPLVRAHRDSYARRRSRSGAPLPARR